MTDTANIVDQIVAGVLKQLGHRAEVKAQAVESGGSNGAPIPSSTPISALEINDDVVTAALLEERGIVGKSLQLGAKSILTPSAREFLAKRKIEWSRGSPANGAATARGAWHVLVVRSTPSLLAALDTVAKEPSAKWTREIAGCPREAAARAVGALCRGECDGAVVISDKPETVAARANRNPRVRAVAVETMARLKSARETMAANLFAIDPAERSAIELRNLLREAAASGKPSAPSDWKE